MRYERQSSCEEVEHTMRIPDLAFYLFIAGCGAKSMPPRLDATPLALLAVKCPAPSEFYSIWAGDRWLMLSGSEHTLVGWAFCANAEGLQEFVLLGGGLGTADLVVLMKEDKVVSSYTFRRIESIPRPE